MTVNRIAKALIIVVLATLCFILIGYVVMLLWNWLMPTLFGLHVISFWQAIGILILSKLLFGGFRGRAGHSMRWRNRLRERWGSMTPEERERFRQSMRGRCGAFYAKPDYASPDAKPATPEA
jgi:predicted membrane chloride channel (bestrophin family)